MIWLAQQLVVFLVLSGVVGFLLTALLLTTKASEERWVEVVAPPPAPAPTRPPARQTGEPPAPGPAVPAASSAPDEPAISAFPDWSGSGPVPWEQDEWATSAAAEPVPGPSPQERDEWADAASNWRSWADDVAGDEQDVTPVAREAPGAPREFPHAEPVEAGYTYAQPVESPSAGQARAEHDDPFPYAAPVEAVPTTPTAPPGSDASVPWWEPQPEPDPEPDPEIERLPDLHLQPEVEGASEPAEALELPVPPRVSRHAQPAVTQDPAAEAEEPPSRPGKRARVEAPPPPPEPADDEAPQEPTLAALDWFTLTDALPVGRLHPVDGPDDLETSAGTVEPTLRTGQGDSSLWTRQAEQHEESGTLVTPDGHGGVAPLVPEGPYGPGSAWAPFDGSPPRGYTIKGQVAAKIYHPRRSKFYSRTHPDVWFETEAHAEAAGFTRWDRRSSVAHHVRVDLPVEPVPEPEPADEESGTAL